MSDPDDSPTRPAPREWVESLEQSRADVAAGRIVPMETVLADLQASLDRMKAPATAKTPSAV